MAYEHLLTPTLIDIYQLVFYSTYINSFVSVCKSIKLKLSKQINCQKIEKIQRNNLPFFEKIQRNNLLFFEKIQRNNLMLAVAKFATTNINSLSLTSAYLFLALSSRHIGVRLYHVVFEIP